MNTIEDDAELLIKRATICRLAANLIKANFEEFDDLSDGLNEIADMFTDTASSVRKFASLFEDD